MKYILEFSSFMERNSEFDFQTEIKEIQKVFQRLGISVDDPHVHAAYTMREEIPYEDYTVCEIKLDTTSVYVSPLSILMRGLYSIEYGDELISNLYPVFSDDTLHKNLSVSGMREIHILIGDTGARLHQPDRFHHLIKSPVNRSTLKTQILDIVLNYWKQTTGHFQLPLINKVDIDAPYVKELIIEFVTKFKETGDVSKDEIAQMLIKAISQSKHAYSLVNIFKDKDWYTYMTMKHFDPNIGMANDLGEMGF